MTTTIKLEDNIHTLVDKKRIELKEKGKKMSIKQITEKAILSGLPFVDVDNV